MPHNHDPNTKGRELDKSESSISIMLPKKQGESALQLLAKLNLLNRKLVPLATNDSILLPLIRAPKPKEEADLEKLFGKQDLTTERFRVRSAGGGSFEEVLARRVPPDIVPLVSKSFDIIGDIAIIEVSPPADYFERTIAEALMQVHKSVKTVYSKAGPITDTQRLRPLHLVLGENRSETIHKEHGCSFMVDVTKAFFSPRLSSEHKRIAEQIQSGECVVDMFAGVGPFAVLIAKRLDRVKVHAIDANPDASKLIEENAKLNRVQNKIVIWSGDAGAIIRKHLSGIADRVIMNHPSDARSFLDHASRAVKPAGGIIHYYTFADGEDCELKAQEEFSTGLANSGWNIDGAPATRRVRGVAPMKWQVVVDARLVQA